MVTKKKKVLPPPVKGAEGQSDSKKTNLKLECPTGIFEPPKLVICGVEGWGKTTILSHIENVGLLIAEGERGYHTLLGAGRAPSVPCLVTDNWEDTLEAVQGGALDDYEAIAMDELSGFERQCHEWVCRKYFSNDWQKFIYYAKGASRAQIEIIKFLSTLEGMGKMIVIGSHCKIETFKDPMNADHDRYVADVDKRTWSPVRRWADAVLFGKFISIVDEVKTDGDKGSKGKGIGGNDRIVYTEHRDTHDAKNRYGLPEEVELSDDPTESWSTIYNLILGREV